MQKLKNTSAYVTIKVQVKKEEKMDAQKPEFQDVAAPALVVDENDNIVGVEEPATETKEEA